MTNELTRRQALVGISLAGATGLVPIAAVASSPAVDRSAWETALAAFRDADAKMEAYDRDHLTPAGEAYMKVRGQWPTNADFRRDPVAREAIEKASLLYDPIQERFDELVVEQGDACGALLELPAPDVEALAVKLEVVAQQRVYEWTENEPVFEALRDDARRLAARRA